MANATQRAIRRKRQEEKLRAEIAEKNALVRRLAENNRHLASLVQSAYSQDGTRRASVDNGKIPIERRKVYADASMQGTYAPAIPDGMPDPFQNAATG